MKKTIFLLLLLGSMQVFSQTKDEKEILNILSNQEAAWNRGDLNSFMIGYWEHDSLMFIGKSGITYGYKKTLANYKNNYPDTASMGQLKFKILSIEPLSNDYKHVVGKWHLKRSMGDLEGHFTLLFKKIKGKWVIVSDHSS